MSEPITLPAPNLDWPPPENKWQRERRAFLKLYPQLLQTHRGKYVAIHEGQLVDSGDDKIAVALRAYERYGYVPILVTLVTDEPPQVVRIRSPRVIRSDPKQ
jgi:hypothetical protein